MSRYHHHTALSAVVGVNTALVFAKVECERAISHAEAAAAHSCVSDLQTCPVAYYLFINKCRYML